MVVNSLSFLIFFITVFMVYYFLLGNRAQLQNIWLLLASYFFYGFAEWKMVPLLLVATIAFYILGLTIGSEATVSAKRRAIVSTFGILLGLGLLLYFKYLNFFMSVLAGLFKQKGVPGDWTWSRLLVPIGISFFTFKLISYIIEVKRGNLEPCRDFVRFALYISFFPTILAGPIDRPKPFLTQLTQARLLDDDLASQGIKRIFWGMFMKMCVADRIAIYVNAVYDNAIHHNGTSLACAALLYPSQMYADFAGYSEMAIGVGCLLGLHVTTNFRRPFFSQTISEYWRKWHISLTGWLTDYVFMPLNIKFRNLGSWGSVVAIIITFVLIGLWHGAALTFAVFGLYHGLLYIPLMLTGAFFKKHKMRKNSIGLPVFPVVVKMLATYLLVALGLIIFRAKDLAEAAEIVTKITCHWGPFFIDYNSLLNGLFCLLLLFCKDFKDEFFPNTTVLYSRLFDSCRYELTVSSYILCIVFFGVFDGGQFIYFKF